MTQNPLEATSKANSSFEEYGGDDSPVNRGKTVLRSAYSMSYPQDDFLKNETFGQVMERRLIEASEKVTPEQKVKYAWLQLLFENPDEIENSFTIAKLQDPSPDGDSDEQMDLLFIKDLDKVWEHLNETCKLDVEEFSTHFSETHCLKKTAYKITTAQFLNCIFDYLMSQDGQNLPSKIPMQGFLLAEEKLGITSAEVFTKKMKAFSKELKTIFGDFSRNDQIRYADIAQLWLQISDKAGFVLVKENSMHKDGVTPHNDLGCVQELQKYIVLQQILKKKKKSAQQNQQLSSIIREPKKPWPRKYILEKKQAAQPSPDSTDPEGPMPTLLKFADEEEFKNETTDEALQNETVSQLDFTGYIIDFLDEKRSLVLLDCELLCPRQTPLFEINETVNEEQTSVDMNLLEIFNFYCRRFADNRGNQDFDSLTNKLAVLNFVGYTRFLKEFKFILQAANVTIAWKKAAKNNMPHEFEQFSKSMTYLGQAYNKEKIDKLKRKNLELKSELKYRQKLRKDKEEALLRKDTEQEKKEREDMGPFTNQNTEERRNEDLRQIDKNSMDANKDEENKNFDDAKSAKSGKSAKSARSAKSANKSERAKSAKSNKSNKKAAAVEKELPTDKFVNKDQLERKKKLEEKRKADQERRKLEKEADYEHAPPPLKNKQNRHGLEKVSSNEINQRIQENLKEIKEIMQIGEAEARETAINMLEVHDPEKYRPKMPGLTTNAIVTNIQQMRQLLPPSDPRNNLGSSETNRRRGLSKPVSSFVAPPIKKVASSVLPRGNSIAARVSSSGTTAAGSGGEINVPKGKNEIYLQQELEKRKQIAEMQRKLRQDKQRGGQPQQTQQKLPHDEAFKPPGSPKQFMPMGRGGGAGGQGSGNQGGGPQGSKVSPTARSIDNISPRMRPSPSGSIKNKLGSNQKTPSMIDLQARSVKLNKLTFDDIQAMHYTRLNDVQQLPEDVFRPNDFLDLDSGDSENEVLAQYKPKKRRNSTHKTGDMIALSQPPRLPAFQPPYINTSQTGVVNDIEDTTGYSNSPKFSAYRLNNNQSAFQNEISFDELSQIGANAGSKNMSGIKGVPRHQPGRSPIAVKENSAIMRRDTRTEKKPTLNPSNQIKTAISRRDTDLTLLSKVSNGGGAAQRSPQKSNMDLRQMRRGTTDRDLNDRVPMNSLGKQRNDGRANNDIFNSHQRLPAYQSNNPQHNAKNRSLSKNQSVEVFKSPRRNGQVDNSKIVSSQVSLGSQKNKSLRGGNPNQQSNYQMSQKNGTLGRQASINNRNGVIKGGKSLQDVSMRKRTDPTALPLNQTKGRNYGQVAQAQTNSKRTFNAPLSPDQKRQQQYGMASDANTRRSQLPTGLARNNGSMSRSPVGSVSKMSAKQRGSQAQSYLRVQQHERKQSQRQQHRQEDLLRAHDKKMRQGLSAVKR